MSAPKADHAEPSTTLFIRNLPFSTTEERLEEVFSDIGPVKRCILVKDKETGNAKGYGFVVYSMLEDAVEAKRKITTLDGRRVFVLYADPESKPVRVKHVKKADDDEKDVQKAAENTDGEASKAAEKSSPGKAESQTTKYTRAKQVILTGFTDPLDAATVDKAVQNVKNMSKVIYPVPERPDTAVMLTFKCVRDSKRAVRRLNGRDFKGQTLKAWQYSSEFVQEPVKSTEPAKVKVTKEQKQCRLIIRNLSFKCTEDDLKSSFQEFGEIMETVIPKKNDGKQLGFGFVQFSDLKSAEKALTSMNMKQIKGRTVAVDWTVPKNQFQKASSTTVGKKGTVSLDEEAMIDDDDITEEKSPPHSKQQRQFRLIIRNLSFKCTAEDLRTSFKEFGEICDAIIPMRNDGKQQGFGFVQFTDLKSAEKAVKAMNKKQIKGRPVTVDWVVPNSEHQKAAGKKDVVSSPDEGAVSGAADEASSSSEGEDDEVEDSEQEEDEVSDDEGFSSKEDSEDGDEDDDGDSDDDDSDGEERKNKGKQKNTKMNRPKANQLEEGRTLFIRNINFDSIVEDLEELLEEFGEMDYCKFVMNPFTEKPKGTAFVQFSTEESAKKCLTKANQESVRGGLVLDGRRLNVILAVSRQDAAKLKEENKTKEKDDKRNLYLAREGLIRPGTQAAVGLTKADLEKRLKVESVKRQKLKNPNIFISDTRLCVRNIPVKTTEKELKKIFRQAAGERTAVVTECRIMKDMSVVNAHGEAKSRGYGFVEFSQHTHALQALRKTNNNPEIFGDKRRPIVEFSLENKSALEAKRKRLERIKAKQETFSKSHEAKDKGDSRQWKSAEKKGKTGSVVAKQTDASGLVKGGKGGNEKGSKRPKVLPSHWGPKVRQRDQGKQAGKKGKVKDHASRKDLRGPAGQKRKAPEGGEGWTEPKKKRSRGNQKEKTDDFESMVNKYRSKLLAASSKSGRKWFADS